MDTPDQKNSICHVQPIQMYQLPRIEGSVLLPFNLLAGEAVFHHGTSVDGLIVLTNYRLYLETGDINHHHVPLGLIEIVEHRDLFYLHIGCKDARTYRCTFENNESCLEWFERISKAAEPPRQLEQLFAFYHYIWSKRQGGGNSRNNYTFDQKLFEQERERLGFEGDSWRISEANINYKLCPTYPPYLIVPSCISDDILESVAKFRSSRRIPAVVWRHSRNGAVIARCSQPEVGWLGWRSSEDEDLIKAISEACNFDLCLKSTTTTTNGFTPPPTSLINNTSCSDKDSNLSTSPNNSLNSAEEFQIPNEINTKESRERKVLIMDARSYTTAVANRARGGGCECPEYYPNCEIQFMNLANIHSIRKSFHALRLLCTSSADQPNWFSQLENTRWLLHMSGLMKAAVKLVDAVEREARPVLVHCSDGWDRTPQIVALAELLLDPYYRTIDGFRILIEREWLAYGHKFADRCGHSTGSIDQNERCPVFLQWLDCVHQLLLQFSCAFEFSQSYLVKLAQHIYSNLYGTFLCNTFQERMKIVNDKTFSVWEFLSGPRFRNHLFAPPGNSSCGSKVLWPQCNVRDLQLWSEVYLGLWEANFSDGSGSGIGSCPGPPEFSSTSTKTTATTATTTTTSSPQYINGNMTKTRSYGDLTTNNDIIINNGPNNFIRRSSDPSINNIDNNKITNGVFLSNEQLNCEEETFNNCCINNGGDYLSVINNEKTENNLYCANCGDCGQQQHRTTTAETATSSDNSSENGELTEPSDENTIISNHFITNLNLGKSVETSTDTLVSENFTISSSPQKVNGFEKLPTIDTVDAGTGIVDSVAGQDDFLHNNNCNLTSKNSTPPIYSRASSSGGWENNFHQPKQWPSASYCLGDDGLVPVRSVAQERLWQILQEHRRKEDALEKELHVVREKYLKNVCHKCSHTNCEKMDDASDDSERETKTILIRSRSGSSPIERMISSVESISSAGESQVSAVESSRSDMSWEALEEGTIYPEIPGTLWVPDHAVNKCTGCNIEFWVGKRKHHCRKCGRIFCADCSCNSTPLPSQQLYNPVRVCTGCFSKLKRDCCTDLASQCKTQNNNGHQSTNTNPQQLTASSN